MKGYEAQGCHLRFFAIWGKNYEQSALDSDIANMVDGAVVAHLNNKLKSMIEICIVCLVLDLVE